jgi:MFS family permease
MNHVYQLLTPLIIPEITRDFGLTNTTAGLLVSCFIVPYSLLPVFSGYLSKFLGRRILLPTGFVISALCFLSLGFVHNIMIMSALLFVAGVGGSTYHPHGAPFLAESYFENRGQALGYHQTGGTLGSIIGPIATGILVVTAGWRPTLMLMAVPGLILALILWFSISSTDSQPSDVAKNEKPRLSNRDVYGMAFLFMAASFIYVLGMRGTDAFANQYFVRGRDISNFFEASLLFASLELAGLFSAPLCGRLSDTFNRKRILVILVVMESVSLYAITATPTLFLVIPCLAFGFAVNGLLAVSDALMSDLTPRESRSTIFGINYTISFTGSILVSPLLFSLADHYGYNFGFILLSVIMPLSIPILLRVKPKTPNNKECEPYTK